MTNEQINALVAERVMGWTLRRARGEQGKWTPTTDIAQAWQVVERMVALGWKFQFEMESGDDPWALFYTDTQDGNAEADTAPLAICLAALRALGVTQE